MENRKRRRRRRRRQVYRARILVGLTALAIVLVAAASISTASKKSAERKAQKEQELKEKELAEEKKKKEAELAAKEKETDPEENPEKTDKPFTLADLDNPEGFDTRPTENGIVLQNPQIDLNGLDTTGLDWGQGGDKDQWNRPAGCLQYQEKFGKYNAYFIKDETEKKVIYLTIDEGYEYGCSPRILDTLKEKKRALCLFCD